VDLNQCISDGIPDMKNRTSLQASKRPCNIDCRDEDDIDTSTVWAYWNLTERDMNQKQEEG
jgi:hypothetical protein